MTTCVSFVGINKVLAYYQYIQKMNRKYKNTNKLIGYGSMLVTEVLCNTAMVSSLKNDDVIEYVGFIGSS
jgi:hypothetical protein